MTREARFHGNKDFKIKQLNNITTERKHFKIVNQWETPNVCAIIQGIQWKQYLKLFHALITLVIASAIITITHILQLLIHIWDHCYIHFFFTLSTNLKKNFIFQPLFIKVRSSSEVYPEVHVWTLQGTAGALWNESILFL